MDYNMKYTRTLLFIIVVLFSSCAEMIECESPISGLWANIDEDGYTSHYISFENGEFTSFRSDDEHRVDDDIIWGVDESSFLPEFEGYYSIEDSRLLISMQREWDPVSYDIIHHGRTMEIDGTCFSLIDGLSSEKIDDETSSPEPEIILSSYSKQIGPDAGAYEFAYSIENPISGCSLSADSYESWITDIKVYSDRITFKVLANTSSESRTGCISLTYEEASEYFEIIQEKSSAKPKIILPSKSNQVDADAGTYEFAYSIENPIPGHSLYAESDKSWITDIKVHSDRIAYKVLANDSSESRTGYISLTYKDVSESFEIIQQAKEAQEYVYSYTFGSGDLGTTGSPKSSVTLGGVTWKFSMKDGGSKFFNFESTGYSRGLQIGKASDPATEVILSTNGIPGTIKSIKVTTCGANGTDAELMVSVGGNSFGSKKLGVEQQEYSFTGSASGEIILKWNATVKAIYLKKIVIEYAY